jgi:Phosphotransferase enzyme family
MADAVFFRSEPSPASGADRYARRMPSRGEEPQNDDPGGGASVPGAGVDAIPPRVRACLDATSVPQRFEGIWSTDEGGPLTVTAGQRQETVFRVDGRCATVWELYADGSGSEHRTIGVLELDPAGASERLYRDDSELPGLREAVDVPAMAGRLASLRLPDLVRIVPIRYHPGRSCVLRYEMGEGRVLYGKLTRAAADLARVMSVVHDAGRTFAGLPRVPRPVALLEDIDVVLQTEEAGEPLGAVLFAPGSSATSGLEPMRAAGRGIASLHDLRGPPGPQRDMAHGLEDLHGFDALFALLLPGLAEEFRGGVQTIEERSHALGAATDVASHGALRTDQLLVGRHGPVMLDLDGYCWSPPARDLGNMLAYLDWRAIRRPDDAARARAGQEALLAGYADVRPLPEPSDLALWRALTMLKIAGRRLQGLSLDEWPHLPRLIAAAARLVPE